MNQEKVITAKAGIYLMIQILIDTCLLRYDTTFDFQQSVNRILIRLRLQFIYQIFTVTFVESLNLNLPELSLS